MSSPQTESRQPSIWLCLITGVIAGGVGIAVAELIAAITRSMRSPVLDVGDRVVDGVPGWVKDLAIEWFGTNDKIALLVGIGSLLTIFAALLGVLSLRKDLRFGYAGAALFGVIGALSALGRRTDSGPTAVLPSVIGAVVVAAVLWWAHSQLHAGAGSPEGDTAAADSADGSPSDDTDPRRRFLAALGALGAAAIGGGLLGRRLEGRFSAEGSRQAVATRALGQAEAGEAGEAAAGPTLIGEPPQAAAGLQAENAAPFYTPNDEFYRIDTALSVPQIDADSWTLKITGMVDQEMELTYDELIDKGLIETDVTMTCVSILVGGDLVGHARWQGVRLDALLEEAGIVDGADQIVGRSSDGYTCGFPVAALDGRDAIVAVAMNGEPLPLEHGFPARLVVPGIYGYASATKWLTEIELTTFADFDQYWVPRGYASEAPIKMQTRIDAPRGLDRIPAGQFAIGGVAWAQPVGVEQVEIKIDDDDWVPADMADELNGSTWRQWSYVWDAEPGRHTVTARAINADGTIQTDERSEPLPDGVTGHHSVVVLVDEA